MMKRKLCALLCALLMTGAPALAEVYMGQPPADWADKALLEWTILDMNEGDGMLLTCGGESMLVDGGPRSFFDVLRAALSERGLERLDMILSTHEHDDHIDGIYALINEGFPADEFLHGFPEKFKREDMRMAWTLGAAEKHGIPVRRVCDGDEIMLGGARLEVIQCAQGNTINACSLALRVSFGSSSALLCADVTHDVQKEWLAQIPEKLDADLIKMPHHAITISPPAFLNEVSPEAFIVTSNRFRLSEKVLVQMQSRNKPILCSGDGTVHAVTDGEDWYVWQTEAEL